MRLADFAEKLVFDNKGVKLPISRSDTWNALDIDRYPVGNIVVSVMPILLLLTNLTLSEMDMF